MALPDWLDPLHDAESMRAADAEAIGERGIPSLQLMESAGAALAEAVRDVAKPGPIRIVCGKGNNGGDGLVAARLLAETGFEVETLLLWPADELSDDSATNHVRLAEPGREIEAGELTSALEGSGCVVDAIFGTGFDGAPRSPAKEAIEAMNGCGAPIVAADIASGVDGSTGEVEGVAAGADVTVTFHAAKLGHRIAPGKRSTGDLRVADIGIPADAGSEPPGWGDHRTRLGASPTARAGFDQVHFRPGRCRGRLARPHRLGRPFGERRDPRRRGLCHSRRPGRVGADLRGEADRGDEPWVRLVRRSLRRRRRRRDPGCVREGRGAGARPGARTLGRCARSCSRSRLGRRPAARDRR